MSTEAWLDASLDLEQRVAGLVAALDAAERTAVLLGDFTALTSRGVPAPHYVDSGTGLRGEVGATAFPAGVALAATFDPDLAEAYGRAVGEEARAAGYTVVLGPTLDLARDPRAGRIPEALGEDPYLSGLLGAAHVRGLQSTHLVAQLKHFVAYNGEDRRTGHGLGPGRGDAVDIRVSDAVLHDTYLRPFQAAVAVGAWSMMGSYTRVNGRYACESAAILAIPRELWGWGGFYCPDFLFAVRDDAAALAAGLDLPALGGAAGRTAAMVAAAPEALVEALVANLARALIGSGLVDDPPSRRPAPAVSTPAHRELAERTAIAASVLLKNDAGALPFGPDVASVAVIGPSGNDALFVVGGSAAVDPGADRLVTPLAGLRAAAGGRRVETAQGSLGDVGLPTVPAGVFGLPDGSGPGVLVEFTDEAGTAWTEVLPGIDHAIDPSAPLARWPRRWTARLVPRATGRHRLSLDLGGRATVRVDGRTLMVGFREAAQFLHGPHCPLQAGLDLFAGTPVEVDVTWEPGPALVVPPLGLGPVLRLGWQEPDGLLDEAVALAGSCDAALVLVNQASSEGMDRESLDLPGDQDDLVRRVAAANPRTVVVLNTPAAVGMPWLDEVAAVLQVWYPGERFGAALGAIVFGTAEPGGRLPLTFPRERAHLPGGDRGPETVAEVLDYDADGGIGYRAPLVRRHGALFGFGHGLGYATTRCRVTAARVAGGSVQLDLEVANPGDRDTVHVAQAYATLAGEAPELAAVLRIGVPAGATVGATLVVEPSAFARWDGAARCRVPVPGTHVLAVGTAGDARGEGVAVTITDGREVVLRHR